MELRSLKEAVKKPDDEQERKAQEYIRGQAKAVYEELQNEKQKAGLDQKEKEAERDTGENTKAYGF